MKLRFLSQSLQENRGFRGLRRGFPPPFSPYDLLCLKGWQVLVSHWTVTLVYFRHIPKVQVSSNLPHTSFWRSTTIRTHLTKQKNTLNLAFLLINQDPRTQNKKKINRYQQHAACVSYRVLKRHLMVLIWCNAAMMNPFFLVTGSSGKTHDSSLGLRQRSKPPTV